MPFTTPEQIIVLVVLLIGGWLLGYASAPGPGKWKRRLRDQSERFTAYHADAKDRARAANQRASDLQSELEAVRADHAEAERAIVALRAAGAPVAVADTVEPESLPEITEPAPVETEEAALPDAEPTVAAAPEPATPVPMTPTATEAPPVPIGPAEPETPRTGWFASSARDPLTRLRGIDEALNARLFELGVVRFEDIEMLSAEDEMALEQRLALPVGTIARDQWRTQAALLRAGQDDAHAAHFSPIEPTPVA